MTVPANNLRVLSYVALGVDAPDADPPTVATIISGITRQQLPLGTTIESEAASGEVYPQAAYVTKHAPKFTFGTKQVATALTAIGSTGAALSSVNPLTAYTQILAEGGMRTTTGNRAFTMASGLIFPRQLSCEERGDASIEFDTVLTTPDGTSAPLSYADTATTPTIPSDLERFTLGPMKIGSLAIISLKSLRIDFGIQAVSEGSDSNVLDSHSYIRTVLSKISGKIKDIAWLDESIGIPLLGKVCTQEDSIFYLRRRAEGGTYVANATASHLKLATAGLAEIDTGFDANGNTTGQASFTVHCTFDLTNAPITITPDSAIT